MTNKIKYYKLVRSEKGQQFDNVLEYVITGNNFKAPVINVIKAQAFFLMKSVYLSHYAPELLDSGKYLANLTFDNENEQWHAVQNQLVFGDERGRYDESTQTYRSAYDLESELATDQELLNGLMLNYLVDLLKYEKELYQQ